MATDEQARLEALWAYDILDTPAEEDYDEIVELASKICRVPTSLITLLDKDRQWFKAKIGMAASQTPIEYAFCARAIMQDDVMIVRDATEDDRFKDNPLVTSDPDIRFYAGMPLITPSGTKLGTLCVIDNKPGDLSDDQLHSLRILSRQVINSLELRLKVKELKAAVSMLDEQSQKLLTLNRNNTRLLSIIGHDVRNPLSGIKSVLDLVKEGLIEPEEFSALSEDLESQVDYAIDLLNNLVEWGVSGRKGTIDKREFDLTFVLGDIVKMQTQLAKSKGLNLTSDVPDGLKICADEDMIRFVVRNLVQNSIKFTKTGQVTVRANEDSNLTYIHVEDTGRGMTDQVKNRLFNWSTRSSEKGTSGEVGTGLGLIMCKEFIDAHEGDILVDSQPGVGSMFTVIIPNQKSKIRE